MENKKALIEYKKESIVSKFINFFKSLFFRNKNIQAEDRKNIIDNNMNSIFFSNESEKNTKLKASMQIDSNIENDKINEVNKESDKDNFFRIYRDFQAGKLTINQVSLYDIIRINKIQEEENKLYLKSKENL